jgi:hypothetical protein
MGWVVSATPRPFYPRERPGTRRVGGWVGPRAVLDGCGKSRPHREWIRGPPSPQRVTIPTELTRLSHIVALVYKFIFKCLNFFNFVIKQGNDCLAVKREVVKGPPRPRSVMGRVMFCAFKLLR